MSVINKEDFIASVHVYFKLHPQERKYQSEPNIATIAGRVESYGVYPSDTAVRRAISELVADEEIARVDGGDSATDRLGAAVEERNRIDRIASAPLTQSDFTLYSRLAPAEVEQRFFGDPVFAARYRRASQQWGFKLPGKPQSAQTTIDQDSEPSKYQNLTAKEYYATPTSQIVRLYQSHVGFKRAVDGLIANGLI